MLAREDRAQNMVKNSRRFDRALTPEQVLAEAAALIAHDRQEEALMLLTRAIAREPQQELYAQARRTLKAALTAAA
jgi:hypothetical protein